MSHMPKDDLWSAPIECNMFTGSSTSLPFVTKVWNINFISYSRSPCCDCAWTYFASRSINSLNSLSRRSHGAGKRFTLCYYLSRYLRTPIGEILSNFKFDRGVFKSTDYLQLTLQIAPMNPPAFPVKIIFKAFRCSSLLSRQKIMQYLLSFHLPKYSL